MAGGKKKKKPASNPARGFATTSIASKPRSEVLDTITVSESQSVVSNVKVGEDGIVLSSAEAKTGNSASALTSPEDFEKQLEESELQVLVEKYSQKSKRDAGRQISRLQTDRRLLRGQAEMLNTRKWLPPELIDEILDVIVADSRLANQAVDSEKSPSQKNLSEEDLAIKLWTLKQTLEGSGFHENKVQQALLYILEVSEKVVFGNKDSVWGLEESLDWLARECSRTELPDYESWQRKPLQGLKSQAGMFVLVLFHTDICNHKLQICLRT
jgi:ATP-dependent RNA helicase DHX29